MIPGIDVSKWQGRIDWIKVKEVGVQFAFIKASQGTSYQDPLFTGNWQAAREAGILRGAYHYFHPKLDAIRQARFFHQQFQEDPGELPPALDLEAPELTGLPLAASISKFLQELENLTGQKAILYTSPGFWNSYLTPYPPEWAHLHPLWIAHYGVGRPTIPYPWVNYTFWQYTNRGEVAGITSFPARRPRVDLNWFHGTLIDLVDLPGKSHG